MSPELQIIFTREMGMRAVIELRNKRDAERDDWCTRVQLKTFKFCSYKEKSQKSFNSGSTISGSYEYRTLYVFKQMKNLLPGANTFNFYKLSHKYDTRHKSVLHMSHCRTKLRQSTVQFHEVLLLI